MYRNMYVSHTDVYVLFLTLRRSYEVARGHCCSSARGLFICINYSFYFKLFFSNKCTNFRLCSVVLFSVVLFPVVLFG